MKPTVTTDQIKRFQADGVVFLEGFFPQEYIDSLTKGIQKNLDDPGPRKHVWNNESEGQYTLYDSDNWNRISEYKKVIQKSELKNIAKKFLKTDKVNFFFESIFVRSKGVQFFTPWHQVEPYWSVEGHDTVSIWMPLVDVRKESALAFVPGSHLNRKKYKQQDFGKLNLEKKRDVNRVIFDSEWETLPDIDADRNKHNVISWEMKAGDCVAFNGRIIHGGGGKLPKGEDLFVFNTQWLGDDVRVNFCSYGMDPDHSKKMKEFRMTSGDRVDSGVYPEFKYSI
ncbi:MAG: phytanoyl-CoA dioxygenase family protein [Paracoccaceae bacterium]